MFLVSKETYNGFEHSCLCPGVHGRQKGVPSQHPMQSGTGNRMQVCLWESGLQDTPGWPALHRECVEEHGRGESDIRSNTKKKAAGSRRQVLPLPWE